MTAAVVGMLVAAGLSTGWPTAEASDGSRARLAGIVVLRKREGLRAAFRESVKMVRTASASSGTISSF